MSYSCSTCRYEGELIKEYRATEKIYTCPQCGKILLRVPFPLAAFETVSGEMIINV